MYYRKQKIQRTSLNINTSIEGETIEMKIERIVNNKEPITDGAPIIFSERKDGVVPGHNIRTDRWEVAIDAMDAVSKAHVAKREARIVEMDKKQKGGESGEGKAGEPPAGGGNGGGEGGA